MRDRIRPTKEHDELLNKLRNDGIFATRQKAMMFAAALGFVADKADTVEAFEGIGEGIPLSIFEHAGDDGFIEAMAVAQADDLLILLPSKGDERLEIFEHYARKGLDRISRACYGAGQEPLQAILDIIDRSSDHGDNPSTSKTGLEDSLKELAKLL